MSLTRLSEYSKEVNNFSVTFMKQHGVNLC